MNKCRLFTAEDLIKSNTANRRGIDNQPSAEIKKELEITACKVNFISILAHAYGATIRVTSGYRCKKLNAIVGGVKASLHMQGRAVDFVVSDVKIQHKLYESLDEDACRMLLGICELIEYQGFMHVGFLSLLTKGDK